MAIMTVPSMATNPYPTKSATHSASSTANEKSVACAIEDDDGDSQDSLVSTSCRDCCQSGWKTLAESSWSNARVPLPSSSTSSRRSNLTLLFEKEEREAKEGTKKAEVEAEAEAQDQDNGPLLTPPKRERQPPLQADISGAPNTQVTQSQAINPQTHLRNSDLFFLTEVYGLDKQKPATPRELQFWSHKLRERRIW
ncbi:hypothetical protein BGZ63DRAFT_377693 [Mariannaea sp. PMI_226]|nr:hypothetical protein BGZ63DRAFT_377693 [Mariannaea sp. PMI_226]